MYVKPPNGTKVGSKWKVGAKPTKKFVPKLNYVSVFKKKGGGDLSFNFQIMYEKGGFLKKKKKKKKKEKYPLS